MWGALLACVGTPLLPCSTSPDNQRARPLPLFQPPSHQDITGATSVDELVRMFVAAEERNYSLFRYASQINAELEQHHQAMAEVRHAHTHRLQ